MLKNVAAGIIIIVVTGIIIVFVIICCYIAILLCWNIQKEKVYVNSQKQIILKKI